MASTELEILGQHSVDVLINENAIKAFFLSQDSFMEKA